MFDLGFYYASGGTPWYTRTDGSNLDLARSWDLIEILATQTDVEMILLDRHLQGLLENYALSQGRNEKWVHDLFHGDGPRVPLLRHSPGHATHLHLRFSNPIARHSAQRLAPLLAEYRTISMPQGKPAIDHVAKPGDTLAHLAQRYHTTMRAIRAANRMPGYQLVAGRTYKIPIDPMNTNTNHSCETGCQAADKPPHP